MISPKQCQKYRYIPKNENQQTLLKITHKLQKWDIQTPVAFIKVLIYLFLWWV